MTVSQYRNRQESAVERAEALGWLQRQLTWEKTLDRLRLAAGVLPAEPVAAATGPRPNGQTRTAA